MNYTVERAMAQYMPASEEEEALLGLWFGHVFGYTINKDGTELKGCGDSQHSRREVEVLLSALRPELEGLIDWPTRCSVSVNVNPAVQSANQSDAVSVVFSREGLIAHRVRWRRTVSIYFLREGSYNKRPAIKIYYGDRCLTYKAMLFVAGVIAQSVSAKHYLATHAASFSFLSGAQVVEFSVGVSDS